MTFGRPHFDGLQMLARMLTPSTLAAITAAASFL